MKINFPALLITAIFLSVSYSVHGAETSGPVKDVRSYQDIGRIEWIVPSPQFFYFAVPHFTVGPRIMCGKEMESECEIQVSARDLTVDAAARREELLGTMRQYLSEAQEHDLSITSLGENPAIEYIKLTHKIDGANVAMGHYVSGAFVIKFHFFGHDPEGAKLKTVLKLVSSAKALDGTAFLAFKLKDYNVACNKIVPTLRQQNDSAFSNSKFATIDYVSLISAAKTTPGQATTIDRNSFEKAQRELIEYMRKWTPEESSRFCHSLINQIHIAEQ